jgi:hypothetical protein
MRDLQSLQNEFASLKSVLQKEERLARFIATGEPVRASGVIETLTAHEIRLANLSMLTRQVTITHPPNLRAQLLSYSNGDEVELALRLRHGKFHDGEGLHGPTSYADYVYELVSITKLQSREERAAAAKSHVETISRQAAAERNAGGCLLMFTASLALVVFSFISLLRDA